jgi:signal transduction histidine kinase
MQTIQGSKLVADEARDHVDNPESIIRALDRLSEWLERAILEEREALEALRSSSAESDTLTAAVRQAADNCAFDSHLKVNVSIRGMERELHPIARAEVYLIGYEAIRNACVHSGGTELRIEFQYRRKSFRLDVHDNGRGIDARVVKSGRIGHFGLTGMREHASSIGGTLNVVSKPEVGTTVSLRVPGNAIYLHSPWRPRLRILEAFRRAAK